MRKKKHPEHVNHERWLVSYADFITLLFAFFVVMFAVSQVDAKKVGRFTEAFSKAMGDHVFPDKGSGVLPASDVQPIAPNVDELPPELRSVRDELAELAAEDGGLQDMEIVERRNEIVIRLSDSVFFDSGEDSLTAKATDILHTLGPVLARHAVEVRVEGHTDNRPIRKGRFRSNWDLSTSRATAVLAKLAADDVRPERLAAAGYGEFRPVADNANEEGRQQNRRVDLVLTISHPESER